MRSQASSSDRKNLFVPHQLLINAKYSQICQKEKVEIDILMKMNN